MVSKYYNLSAQHLPINEIQVQQALDRVTTYLLPKTQPFTFQQRLSELYALKNLLSIQEKSLYTMFNVKDISELKTKIDSYRGLATLNGAKLAKHIASLKLVDDSAESLASIVNNIINSDSFRNSIYSGVEGTFVKEHINDIIDMINQQFNTKFVKNSCTKTVGLTKLLKDVVIENGIAHVQNLKRADFSSSFLKHLEKIFSSAQSNNNGVKLTLTEYNRSIYKGWRVRKEELKDKIKEQEIRKNFLDICINFIKSEFSASNEEINAFTESFSRVPTSALLISDISGLQGIIGEAATGAYLYLLTNGKYNVTQTANMFRKGRKQLTAIDVILEEFGFQVKNYNEFAYDIPNTIELSKTNALETWEEKFELNGALTAALNTFYAIKGYNVKVTNEYTLEPRINATAENLSQFFLQYSDKILEMSDELQGQDFFTKDVLEGRFYKVFWVMSGRFIPSSYILNTIINYFESQIELKDFYLTVSSSYTGGDYSTFWDKKDIEEILTFPQVINSTKLTMNWRFHLDNIMAAL